MRKVLLDAHVEILHEYRGSDFELFIAFNHANVLFKQQSLWSSRKVSPLRVKVVPLWQKSSEKVLCPQRFVLEVKAPKTSQSCVLDEVQILFFVHLPVGSREIGVASVKVLLSTCSLSERLSSAPR